jgi:VIT1/CCC1 family predicted Fe2+/Mn2+ transporter
MRGATARLTVASAAAPNGAEVGHDPGLDHDHDHDHTGHPAATEHAGSAKGWLRAAVFGASDGLVSNAALVLGVSAGGADPEGVVLAGVAGLVAGAASMAAGEWISVQAHREALERELARERAHLRDYPAAERAHMRHVLQKAGISADVARQVALDIEEEPEQNLGFHARMELGIEPDELGSPVQAALASFASFALGALVPLIPWAIGMPGAQPVSIALSAAAAFGVGALLSGFTTRAWWASGLRQLGVGALAAGVTTVVGALFGATVG